MKKIISLIIAILILLSCFSFTAFGETLHEDDFSEDIYDEVIYADLDPFAVINISDDYKTLYCGNKAYTRFSPEDSSFSTYAEVKNEIILSDAQKQEVKDISLTATEKGEIIDAGIAFKDGSYLSVTYMLENLIEEYNRLSSADYEDCFIDFSLDDENIVETTKTLLKGEKVTLKVNEIFLTDWFSVNCMAKDKSFFVTKGMLLEYSDDYYYIDFKEINSSYDDFDQFTYEGKAYKITDPLLIQQIGEAIEKYYNDTGYGFLFDDNFTEKVSNVFLVLVFGIVPFVIFVLSLIFGIRSKKIYKKLLFTISALSAAELAVFATIAFLIIK